MKTLPPIRPTAEQLPLISDNTLGAEVIRGAAGSGKTSTAILRLRSLAYMFEERRAREGRDAPVRILVLTFNRTLCGYVEALVEEQIEERDDTVVHVNTFARWAMHHIGQPRIVREQARDAKIRQLASALPALAPSYVVKEVDYLLGRFRPEDLNDYLTAERTGRGIEPRVDRPLRRKILDDVIAPYQEWLRDRDQLDWNDVAVAMTDHPVKLNYDVVVIDESQDFSANQLRAVKHHIADAHAVTFVIDTIQRIYARGFTWAETGFDIRPNRSFSLRRNHRNTQQIAAFALGILQGVPADPDGSLPDLTAARTQGSLPTIIRGRFSRQAAWAIDYIQRHVDLADETVAFLHPKGYGFFGALRGYLNAAGIDFVEISREAEWPDGDENVALSTFHSAKGLEFDHVFILGLNHETTAHEDEDKDDQLTVLRRLLAVAVARARSTVVIGYKDEERSRLVDYFADNTFNEVDL